MISKKLGSLHKDKKGVTAIEYGMIAGLIAVVIIGAVQSIGGSVNTAFTSISTALTNANIGGGGGGGGEN
jgi:pilus assembly protein Flp/PilA